MLGQIDLGHGTCPKGLDELEAGNLPSIVLFLNLRLDAFNLAFGDKTAIDEHVG